MSYFWQKQLGESGFVLKHYDEEVEGEVEPAGVEVASHITPIVRAMTNSGTLLFPSYIDPQPAQGMELLTVGGSFYVINLILTNPSSGISKRPAFQGF